MPAANVSKPLDKRKKSHGQQVSSQHEDTNDRTTPNSDHKIRPAVSHTASFRSAGNRSEFEPGSQSPTSPQPAHPTIHSRSESAIGHIHMRKKSSPLKKDKRKEKDNRDSHPLNLPPDELRRLSAAMAAQEGARSSMDVDTNGQVSSPSAEPATSPLKAAPGAFPDNANGTMNGINGAHGDEKSPTPPPHRVSVPEKPMIDAEAAKAAGNKFFKAKDYSRAIAEYTKGLSTTSPLHEDIF